MAPELGQLQLATVQLGQCPEALPSPLAPLAVKLTPYATARYLDCASRPPGGAEGSSGVPPPAGLQTDSCGEPLPRAQRACSGQTLGDGCPHALKDARRRWHEPLPILVTIPRGAAASAACRHATHAQQSHGRKLLWYGYAQLVLQGGHES